MIYTRAWYLELPQQPAPPGVLEDGVPPASEDADDHVEETEDHVETKNMLHIQYLVYDPNRKHDKWIIQ